MAAVLIVSRDRKQVQKVALTKDVSLIGRSDACELHLNDNAVSRHHAAILMRRGAFEVEDKNSRNGTMLNGERLSGRSALADGDLIAIGPFEIRFHAQGEAADSRDSADAEGSATQFVAPEELSGKARKPRAPRAKPQPGQKNVKLVAAEGPLQNTVYRDWAEALAFGRDPANDVVLPDDSVSLKHARVERRAEGCWVVDLGSANGTFLNGVRVEQAKLENGARLRIGLSTFAYSEVDPQRQRTFRLVAALVALFLVVVLALVKLLQPVDQSAVLSGRGWELYKKGGFAEAGDYFQKALEINPESQTAKEGLEMARRDAQTAAELDRARAAANNQDFEGALNICYAVLRVRPDYEPAQRLQSIIKSIEDARVALDARNWTDSLHLLNDAQKTYPDSTVIRSLQERAGAELTAQKKLTKAREFLEYRQLDSAQELLREVPKTSVYYAEARGMLDTAESAATAAEAVQAAQLAFRDGNLTAALGHIDAGLKANPENADLAQLKKKLLELLPLTKLLEGAPALFQSSAIPAIREMLSVCDQIAALDADVRNKCRAAAEDVKAKLLARLQEIARDAVALGEQHYSAQDYRKALEAYSLAVAADAEDATARDMAAKLTGIITTTCKKHFQEGIVHEELGQTALAITAYQKVLEMAVPGEDYYQRAKDRLTVLQK